VPFKTILRNLVERVPGSRGAIVADWEGEAVDQFSYYDDYELKVTGAHKGIILAQIKEIHDKLFNELPQEAVISTDTLHVIIGTIGRDYSLVMTVDRGVVVGKALYWFRQAVLMLHKEIY
jgi:predicted regulator of Ras-like GTPase activity (Roadblock/LC7/MglB family)